MQREQRNFALMMTAPVVIGLIALLLYPTIYLVILSFQEPAGGEFTGFGTISSLLGSSEFWWNTWVSVKFTFLSTVISFVLGFSLAYSLEVVRKGHPLFITI